MTTPQETATMKPALWRAAAPLIVLASAGTLAATTGSAVAAAPAQVRVAGEGAGATLQYRSADVTVNRITVEEWPAGPGFVLRDSSGTLTLDTASTGGRCRQDGGNAVYCSGILRLYVELGAGDDTFAVATGVDLDVLLWAGDGDDTVTSGWRDDELHGGDGDDTIRAGRGWDYVYGGGGADRLYGDQDHDYLNGEGGNDKAYGGDGNDLLVNPDRTRDEFYGDNGDDVLDSANRLYAGNGDDVVWVNARFGDYYGQAGRDTINYGQWPYAQVHVSLDGNDNDGRFAWDCPWYVNCPDIEGRHNVHGDFERVVGTPGPDVIQGNDEPDLIEGSGGDDILKGKGGDDVLDAGPGTGQETDGGSGTDTCRGVNLARTPGCDNF
jgi:Ca2+-binding RTX toxin-like protein